MESAIKLSHVMLLNLLLMSCVQQEEWIITKSSITDGLHDIEIVNQNVAFVYTYGTGKVFQTTDGGAEWELVHQFDSIYFEQIQFVDENNGWLCGSPNKLFKTQDGGRTWSDHSLTAEPDETLIYGMCFQSASNGYVAALNMSDEPLKSNIYFTSDGGKEWQLINSVNEMILNLEEIDNTIYASGDNVIIKDIQKRHNWAYSFHDTLNVIGQIRDLEVNSDGDMMASSFNGYILNRKNGVWETQRITKNRIRSLTSMNNYWLAVGDSNKESKNMYVSKDNGEHWSAIENQFLDIHRIDNLKGRFWAVGKEGLMMTKRMSTEFY